MFQGLNFGLLRCVLLQNIIVLDFVVEACIINTNHYIIDTQEVAQKNKETRWHNALKIADSYFFSASSQSKLTIFTEHDATP